MRSRILPFMFFAISLVAAACGNAESQVVIEPLRGLDGEPVGDSTPEAAALQASSDLDATPPTTTITVAELPAEEPVAAPTRLGTAPALSNDPDNEGCTYISDEQITEIVSPPEGFFIGIEGISRFASCTYLGSQVIENTVHIDVSPVQRGTFFDAVFLSQYHIEGDPFTGSTREVSAEPYGDESFLFRSPTLGPEIAVNIDGVLVTVRVKTLDDNSDEAERIENVREIVEHILQVS